MSTSRSVRRWVTVAAAAASFALIGGAAASPAFAIPTATIDDNEPRSLSIHKYEQPLQQGAPATGADLGVLDPAVYTPIGGVEFTATQVPGFDLTTNAGWEAAAALNGDPAAAKAIIDAAVPAPFSLSRTTLPSGLALFEQSVLPIGLYYVTENLTAAQLTSGITPSAPFLVTLPLTDPVDPTTWLYDVHVYPKNNVDTITKFVEDTDTVGTNDPANGNVNDVIWTIDATIPTGGETDLYYIEDELDERLTYVGVTAAIAVADPLTPNVPAGSPVALTPVTDYVITAPVAPSTTVTVTLTPAGRAAIWTAKQANVNSVVQLKLTTTSDNAGIDGVIPNDALLFPNQFRIDNNLGGIPSNEVETRLGNIEILKTDDQGVPLEDAEFALFLTEADARAATKANLAAGNALDIPGLPAGTKTVTTDSLGVATIESVRLSNFEDGEWILDTDPGFDDRRSYWIVEVASPDGFQLLAEPIQVFVDGDDSGTPPTTVVAASLTVVNVPDFVLPLTGGTGTIIFTVAGLGIILLAAGIYVARRRSSNAAA